MEYGVGGIWGRPDRGASRRRRIVRGEERPARLFVIGRLEDMVLAEGAGARGRRTGVDRLEEPLQMRKGPQRILRALQDARGTVEPAPGRHVGDGVGVAE